MISESDAPAENTKLQKEWTVIQEENSSLSNKINDINLGRKEAQDELPVAHARAIDAQSEKTWLVQEIADKEQNTADMKEVVAQ